MSIQEAHSHNALTGSWNSTSASYSGNTVSLGYKSVNGFGGMEPTDTGYSYAQTAGRNGMKLITTTTPAINVTSNITNANTGAGQAHNNMPPYLAVNMWQRTA